MKVNQLKAGVILSYSSMILGYIIAIVYTPIMLRLLGQSEYGLYNLVSSVVSYLGLLSFGFGSAYVRFYSRYKVEDSEREIAKLNGMFLIIFSVIGVIAVFAGSVLVANTERIFGAKLLPEEMKTAKTLMVIMVFNIALSFPASVFNSYITANEKFVFQKLLQMIKVVAHPFLVLPVLLLGYRSVGMVVVTTALTILIEISNVIFCLRKLDMRFSFKEFDFTLMKEMTIFSSFLFMNMIIDQINWNVDKFLLGRFRGTIAVAIYGLAAQLNTYYMSLSTAISSVFIPRVNRMVSTEDDSKQLTDLFTRVGRVQFIVLSLICSGLILFGKPFIAMWAGHDYVDSYPIVLLLIVPVTIPLIQNLGVEIQKAKNMHQFRSWVYFFIALGNLVISIPLTYGFGGFGSALGTAISLLIGNGLIMNWYYHYRVGLDMKYFWLEILKFVPSLVLPTIAGIVLTSVVDIHKVGGFLLAGFLYTIVFVSSMWFLGMNQYEKELIGGPIRGVLLRANVKRGQTG
jgi:O-antigen/teichoic acid export membrane protein